MVIMDRQDYINKANNLLNQNTYRSIPRDPTNAIKNKLISILKRVKNQTGLDSNTYKSLYPTACVLMAHCPSLCTGNPHILTSTYSGTVTITSQPKFSVIHTLSHRASTVCGKPELLQQEREHLRKALTKCKYPKWVCTRWRKDSTGLPDRLVMGASHVPNLSLMK